MPGTHPPIFWLGERQRQYPPILLRTFGYSRPILVAQTLPTEPPKDAKCGGGVFPSHTPPHSVVRPPNFELALTPLPVGI